MGMFDYVKYEAPCPNCGRLMRNFQSKDGDCLLATLEPKDVRTFYALCDCSEWVEFEVIPPSPSPTDYTIRLVPDGERMHPNFRTKLGEMR